MNKETATGETTGLPLRSYARFNAKARMLAHFQHWLGTNYSTLPTDSTTMSYRANKFLKENIHYCDN